MHIHHDHVGAHGHEHEHTHTHEHTHDGHTHEHEHCHCHDHDHDHPHTHEHLHEHGTEHTHSHECGCGHDHHHDHGHCHSCGGHCEHTADEELKALMKYMIGHNAAHAKELAQLATKLQETGNRAAYEQVLAAVSDFEKGNMRLSVVLASLGG